MLGENCSRLQGRSDPTSGGPHSESIADLRREPHGHSPTETRLLVKPCFETTAGRREYSSHEEPVSSSNLHQMNDIDHREGVPRSAVIDLTAQHVPAASH